MMMFVILLVLAGLAGMVGMLGRSTAISERDKKTAEALAQAKEALISYATTYSDTHSGAVSGYVPCPDAGSSSAEGIAATSCGGRDVSVIGRLPWKSLGLPPLVDANAECLWYVAAGSHKNNTKSSFMNWDTNGLLEVMASDGTTYMTGSMPENRAVAVVFSPGAVLGGQDRTPAVTAPVCGGNYTALNYLDTDTVHGLNNATISSVANALIRFVSGQIRDASASTVVNDRLIFITKDEIFNVIKRRNDFALFVSAVLMPNTVGCLSTTLPAPVTVNFSAMTESLGITTGSLVTGRIPIATANACGSNYVREWRDNLLYAKCASGGGCLTVNGSSCRGVVIFPGEKHVFQRRNTTVEKNNWINYLEGSAATDPYPAFSSGSTLFTGPVSYSPLQPAADLLACIA